MHLHKSVYCPFLLYDSFLVFQKESFIEAVTDIEVRNFLKWFVETAMFSAFIESRLKSESDIQGE
jgi:hypothetical protein